MVPDMTPTVILTRPKTQSESFAADLRARWDGPIEIIHSPLIEITSVAASVTGPDAVIFTSANGVIASGRLGLPSGLTAWCVGPKTAVRAQEAGFLPIVGPGDADGLAAQIIAARPAGKFAHIRGRHTRAGLCARLNAAGIACDDVVAYAQKALTLTSEARFATSAQKPVIFPLFSPRTATIFSGQAPFVSPVHAIALSHAVAHAIAPGIAQSVTVAQRPDGPAMTEATLAVMAAQPDRAGLG